jgi:hypothetical protein
MAPEVPDMFSFLVLIVISLDDKVTEEEILIL